MSQLETKQSWLERYHLWLQQDGIQQDLREELAGIQNQPDEIEDRFYKDIEFGTAGIRGVIGAGTNRLNIYTVRKVVSGLASYILNLGTEAMKRGVAIAYDSRKYSREFAEEAARVLDSRGIPVFLFEEMAATPLLSYAIRYFRTAAGIVVTASHNPPQFNGLKVYDEHGGQITDGIAEKIYAEIQRFTDPLAIHTDGLQKDRGQGITLVGEEVLKAYTDEVRSLLLNRSVTEQHGKKLRIVYTPLHGTGNVPVRSILEKSGFSDVHVVEAQAQPDQQFSTVKAPNPEEKDVFELALKLAEEVDADLIMATDPDADRLGVLVKADGEYKYLSGNQIGVLILHYLLEQKQAKGLLPKNGAVLNSIVTSGLGEKIAGKYGLKTVHTLTGFKYIGEKINEYKVTGDHTFVFGYEESYGYLAGDFVRDKDAVQTTAIVAEMVLVYKEEGKHLFQVLAEIYREHGYYWEDYLSITFSGASSEKNMREIMRSFRQNPPEKIAGLPVRWIEDYESSKKRHVADRRVASLDLPKSDVLKFVLEDSSWIAIRPSGTEPKMKVYFSAVSLTSMQEAIEKADRLKRELKEKVNTI
ncbi:phospho-sugar mutase [Brevibacillus sp. B_LB10_24]|uniref:phospho-sugar mutase n=1 Tax=Brevibacillus sp. B_LB10_24 TaxID=3380645 RepID=UPI0038BD35EA